MALTDQETHFLNMIQAAMAGRDCPAEGADWPAMFSLAGEQKLLPVLFEAVCRTTNAGGNAALFAAAKRQVIAQVTGQAVRAAEFSALYGRLRAAGLHPLVVKGQLCSRLYPQKDHRISADDDLLAPGGEFAACHRLLLANGLRTDLREEELDTAGEACYTKPGSLLHIELHRRLFDTSDGVCGELNRFFQSVRPVQSAELLAMPPHEHLLYLILHALKHFISCGVGLRQFCDIGLWAREYCGQIDWQRLHEQCTGVHAAAFAAAAFAIARDTLGIAFDLPAPWGGAVDVEPMLHDALSGGVYGSNSLTRLHAATVTLGAVKAGRRGRPGSLWQTLFPPRTQMERRYPYLKTRPALLPAAWIQRLIRYAGEKQSSAAGSFRLAGERVELMKFYQIF